MRSLFCFLSPPPPPPPLPCPSLSSPPPSSPPSPPLSTSPPLALQPIPSSPPPPSPPPPPEVVKPRVSLYYSPPPPIQQTTPPPSCAPPPSLPPVNTEPYNYISPPPPTIRSPPPSTPPPVSVPTAEPTPLPTLPPPPVPTTSPPLPSVSVPPPVEPPVSPPTSSVSPYRTTTRPGAVNPSNNSSSHNIVISREAAAAIVVVAGLVTLSFVGVAFWFVKQRRRPNFMPSTTVGSQLSGSRDMTPSTKGKGKASADDETESSQRNICDNNAYFSSAPDPSLQSVLPISEHMTFDAGHPETTKQVSKVISQEKHSQFEPEVSEKVACDTIRKTADKQLQDMMNKAYKAATKSFEDSMLEWKAHEIAPPSYDWINLRYWSRLVDHCCSGAFANRSQRNALNRASASGSRVTTGSVNMLIHKQNSEIEKGCEPIGSEELLQPTHMKKKTGKYNSVKTKRTQNLQEGNERDMVQKYEDDKDTLPNYDDDVGYSTKIDDQNAHSDNYCLGALGNMRGMFRSSGSNGVQSHSSIPPAPHLTKEFIDMISSQVFDRMEARFMPKITEKINLAFRDSQGGSGSQQASMSAPQDDKNHDDDNDGDNDEGKWSDVGGDGTT